MTPTERNSFARTSEHATEFVSFGCFPLFTMRVVLLFCCVLSVQLSVAQTDLPKVDIDFETASMPEVEEALKPLFIEIRDNRDAEYKLKLNTRIYGYLQTLLKRPESFAYPFDSLKTISKLYPADSSFRIYTWEITDRDDYRTFSDHTYYGFIQRRYQRQDGKLQYIVIPLTDATDARMRIENEQLDHESWLGALYYHPRHQTNGVMTFEGKAARYNSMTGRAKREPITYYIMLGLNRHDIRSNYKIVEAISFDPEDSTRALFGLPIFHYSSINKYRVVYKYSDNSFFNMNYGHFIDQGLIFKRKREGIVFDHLVEPKQPMPGDLYTIGPDGSYDALYWLNRVDQGRKGFFIYLPNIAPYSPEMEKYDPKVVEQQAEEARRRQMESGVQLEKDKKKKR